MIVLDYSRNVIKEAHYIILHFIGICMKCSKIQYSFVLN